MAYDNASFLKNGGEMGRLMRDFNWSTTSIGIPEHWPQSLRTTLSILLNSRFPMFLWWGPEMLCFYNDAYRPSLGNQGKHPSILGQPAIEAWPEIWDFIFPLISQVLSGQGATWHEDQFLPIFRNGKVEDVYWTFSYSPVIDESDKAVGVFVTCTETTKAVISRKALAVSEERFRNLIHQSNVGIVVLMGEDLRITIVNDAYGRLIDRTTHELLGKKLWDVIPEASADFNDVLQKVLLTGETSFRHEAPYYVFAGDRRIDGFLNLIYQPYREADGSITGIIAMCQDVTEQVLSHRQVEETKQRLELALEIADLGDFTVNLETNTASYSPRIMEWFGIERQIISMTEILDRIYPEDRDKVKRALAGATTAGNNGKHDVIYRVTMPTNGNLVYLRSIGQVQTKNGIPVKIAGIIQDVTDLIETQQKIERQVTERTKELNLANSNLQKSNEDLAPFAYVASHDLQEPLRKITTFAELLDTRFGHELSPAAKVYLGKIDKSAERMTILVRDILKYSRLQRDQKAVIFTDLNKVLKDVLIDFDLLIEEKRATVVADTLPVIETIPAQIAQLFRNLISNSLKFAREDIPPQIIIKSRLLPHDEYNTTLDRDLIYWRMTFADNGIGFEPEYAEQIFQIFQRLHGKKDYPGTGIGLAMCRKIAVNHRGEIHAKQSNTSGAVFTILLPATQS